jgi:hypothetical protein
VAIHAFEEEKKMPLLSPTEQMWQEDGIAKGMQQGMQQGMQHAAARLLRLRFGQAGLDLMPQVRRVTEPASLEALLDAIESTAELDSLRKLLPPEA